MTDKERGAIVEALKTYISRYPSQNKAAASLNGISAATLSAMVNGKHELISDEMWKNVAGQIMAPAGAKGWQLVETRAFKEITYALRDSQLYGNTRWILGNAGCGKSTAARVYASENKEVFVILCDKTMKLGDFAREIARKVGFRNLRMRVRDLLEATYERIMRMESPLIIFDEGDKLNDNMLGYCINIYNRLEGKCGITFLSTCYMKHRLKYGINKKEGYDEIDSRIGRRFFELEPAEGADVAAICRANGLTDEKGIVRVIRDSEKSDFDLRCVKSAVHREKRMAGQL